MDASAAPAPLPNGDAPSPHPRPAPRPRKKYRGGFTTSICDMFRNPHRRTDCCAVACCGVLASDRSRYLMTGKRPPSLYVRALLYLIVPGLFVAAMNHFADDVPVDGEGSSRSDGGNQDGGQGGQDKTEKAVSLGIFWVFVLYIIVLVVYGFVKNQSTRREIMTKLYEERARERGEDVDPSQLKLFLSRHSLDTLRAHSCFSCCYQHDSDYYDETTGATNCDDAEEVDHDFCTRLWDWLASIFWCCGCFCQCCGICAVAQEEREVDRLTGKEEHSIDYLTFQPFSEYYPSIQALREEQSRDPTKHMVHATSKLSSKLLKHVLAVLVILAVFALSDVDKNFSWGNMVVLVLTLGQAFFIEYLVHWRWNLFDLSSDSVVKYFACGFLLTTPIAIVFEMLISILVNAIYLISLVFVVASDSELGNDLATDPKKGLKDLLVNHPAVFILLQFANAFVIAALVEELVKYFGYRMVVTPDLLHRDASITPALENDTDAGAGSGRTLVSQGAGITVAMVSVALGFACCENLMYIFVYAPPSLGTEIVTLVARSLFPVHPLCAAIQSIGVCKRDLEGDKRFGLGRIILPAILLHGSFDFVVMVSAYFQMRKKVMESNDDGSDALPFDDKGISVEELVAQIPALVAGLMSVLIGYAYYVFQSRAQTRRLETMDIAIGGRISPLV